MPVLRRLDLRGGTRGIGRPPYYDLGAQSVTAANSVQSNATGVAKVEVT
jgi:hypothetical protein